MKWYYMYLIYPNCVISSLQLDRSSVFGWNRPTQNYEFSWLDDQGKDSKAEIAIQANQTFEEWWMYTSVPLPIKMQQKYNASTQRI